MTAGLHHALDNATEAEAAARALERDEKVDVIVAISTTTARSGPPPRSPLCSRRFETFAAIGVRERSWLVLALRPKPARTERERDSKKE
jgi:hypothetical protein